MATVVVGSYEGESEKAAANLAKHGVSFVEAVTALQDPRAAYIPAGDADGEQRFAAVGRSAVPRLLLVVHVERATAIDHQGSGPSSFEKEPVGPSSPRSASRTGSRAACSTVRTPRKSLRSVAV